MANEQLIEYVKRELASGASKEVLVQALLSNGWSAEAIRDAFATIEILPTVPLPPVPAVPSVPAPVAPIAATSTPPTAAQGVTIAPGPKPASMRYFEFLMYFSIIASIAVPVLQYWSSMNYNANLTIFLSTPLVMGILTLVFTLFAAYGRKNSARIALIILFLLTFQGLISAATLLVTPFYLFAFMHLAGTVANVAALVFMFSPSANRWFDPTYSEESVPLSPGEVNTLWTKIVPRTNWVCMIISLALVFGLDVSILIQSPTLAWYWYEMLAVQAVFIVFFVIENFVFKKRFSSTRSKQDTWITALVFPRNVLFILNAIPLIQLLGAVILLVAALPYLIIYSIIIHSRLKGARASVAISSISTAAAVS